MASPLDPCDCCGRPFGAQGAGLRVLIRVGFSPNSQDLDAEELEAEDLPEWLVALFDTTPGIGAASVELCEPCAVERIRMTDEETRRLMTRSARSRP